MRLSGLSIEFFSYPFFNCNSTNRTLPDACSQAITKFIANYLSFSINHKYSILSAGDHTFATTVAESLIYLNGLSSDHSHNSLILIFPT